MSTAYLRVGGLSQPASQLLCPNKGGCSLRPMSWQQQGSRCWPHTLEAAICLGASALVPHSPAHIAAGTAQGSAWRTAAPAGGASGVPSSVLLHRLEDGTAQETFRKPSLLSGPAGCSRGVGGLLVKVSRARLAEVEESVQGWEGGKAGGEVEVTASSRLLPLHPLSTSARWDGQWATII